MWTSRVSLFFAALVFVGTEPAQPGAQLSLASQAGYLSEDRRPLESRIL